MVWVLMTIVGAGAAGAACAMAKAYERMAAVRDELDDSLHARAMEQAERGAAGK
jgi:hypothetical protein